MAYFSGAVSLYFALNFIAYNGNDQTAKIRIWRPMSRREQNIVVDIQEIKTVVSDY